MLIKKLFITRWTAVCFFVLFCIACHHTSTDQATRVQIRLSKDAQSVCITGLEYDVLQKLKNDSLTLDTWKNLFPVYSMPADTDMKDYQKEQPGTYRITDSTITFKPDTAFKKTQKYFARFYGYGLDNTPTRLIHSQANIQGPKFIEAVLSF